ncbi:MAG: family 43 glycosylhydrolase [Faecousia sp.]
MKARNPVLPLQYHCPDGEPHFIDGELFVYPSYDLIPKRYCSDKLYVAHSKDLENWNVDGPAFESSRLDWPMAACPPAGLMEAACYDELPKYLADFIPKWFRIVPFRWFQKAVNHFTTKPGGDKRRRLLFAPDALTVGGRSYLFFCTSDGCEGVAVSNSPAGPFWDPVKITGDKSGQPISGIDPAVFRDDDGKVYLYWGQINSYGAELTEDLTQIKEDTLVCSLLTEQEHAFHEGSSVRKIGDTYYYLFADSHRGKPTALGYATSKSPLGPFTYQGIVIDNDGCDPETWNNHGSIECVNGQWYVFYHRSTGNSRYLRRMCAEPIYIDETGRISEVLPTSIGMGEPYKNGEPLYGYQACQVKNAYIDGENLTIKKGIAVVVYRYVDTSESFTRIAWKGTGNAVISHEIDSTGVLTLTVEAKENCSIQYFTLHA